MNLLAIRTEILAHGFDPTTFSAARLNQYINDGLALIARRVDYYVDEKQVTLATVAGTSTYTLLPGGLAGPAGTAEDILSPSGADYARIKSVLDTDRQVELEAVSERDMDRSSAAQGTPNYYAISYGGNLRLYPTPDGVHNLIVRAWSMPPLLVGDTDVPQLPEDWHHLLWVYACWICYEAEDDASMGQYWMNRFNAELAEFSADAKFPNSDFPTQCRGMWDDEAKLSQGGWALYLGY